MAQRLRVCKPEICSVIRSYGTQRYERNHYETLKVSPNASQKEIRRAFLRLSKQLHPDTSGKHSHTDFVKLNEAYSILGKENARQEYDLYLKYRRHQPSYKYNTQNVRYGSQWEYEVRSVGGPWPPPQYKGNTLFGLIIALLFFGFGLAQLIFMLHSMRVRQATMLRQGRLEHEYQRIRNVAHIKSNDQFAIKDLQSEKDFDEYLGKCDSE